jgi:hypothetical protein
LGELAAAQDNESYRSRGSLLRDVRGGRGGRCERSALTSRRDRVGAYGVTGSPAKAPFRWIRIICLTITAYMCLKMPALGDSHK